MRSVRTQSIVFRPAESEAELESLLRLRYRVFEGGDVRAFLTPNEFGIDLDSYDINAHHVGLFRDDVPIGYARLITKMSGPQREWIESIVRRYPGLRTSWSEETTAPFPVLSYAGDIGETREWILGRKNGVVEASRLSLVPEQRSFRLVRFMSRALVSYWRFAGYETAVMACRTTHVRMWESMGFRPAPGTREFDCKGIPARVLVITRDWLPDVEREIVGRMAGEFSRRQMIAA